MKKKLIIAAVGAALAAGAMVANAAPTVYGHAHVSIDKFDNGASTSSTPTATAADGPGNSASGIGVSSNSSRIGVKGTEDLGGGLAAAYQAEFGYSSDEDGGLVSQRNSFVGLAGGFGTVLAGRHDTPYKLATGSLDPFSETVGDYNAIVGSTAAANGLFDLRVSNAIAYVSPNLGGVTIIGAYTVGPLARLQATSNVGAVDELLGQANGGDQQDVTAISLAALYSAGPLFVSAAYENHDIDAETLGALTGLAAEVEASHSAMKVGAGYDFGVAKVGLVVEKTKAKDKDILGTAERQAVWATGTFPIGNSSVSVAYGKADASENGSDPKDGATLMTVGFFHNFSKTTKAYVVYAAIDNEEAGNYQLGVSGHGDNLVSANNEKSTALSVGMSVDF